jgi:4-amino-4-deoxy-L-arabinose transferase-like glycosyltransferase
MSHMESELMTYNSRLKFLIILTAFFSYLFIATSFPLSGHNDTQVHIDYAWQLSNDSKPQFYEGLKLPYDLKFTEIQFAAHHPPLYYELISPLTGYLINNGYSYETVVLSVRLFNALLALITLTLVALYSELFNLFKKPNFDILFVTVFAFFLPFAKVSGLVFSESLLVLLITATWICTLQIIRNGYTHRVFWPIYSVSPWVFTPKSHSYLF